MSPTPNPKLPTLILVMGVAGCGKTTIGRRLADELGWSYHEADDFHSAANKEKMGRGIPLNDDDRAPWLAAIREAMEACRQRGKCAIFTCSALKEKYRQVLLGGLAGVALVHLNGSRDLLAQRISGRQGHYMKPGMLDSQLAILEAPPDALTVSIDQTPEAIVATIRGQLGI